MSENFHKNLRGQDFSMLMRLFNEALEAFESKHKIETEFTDVFKANKAAINAVIKSGKFSQFIYLFKAIWSKVERVIKSKSSYHNDKSSVFQSDEVKYIYAFRITNKEVLDYLEVIPIATEKDSLLNMQKKYFKKFLSITTLFCKVGGLVISIEKGKIQVQNQGKDLKTLQRTEYYLFYNRSHQKKMSLGIGTVVIERNIALITYFYKPTPPNLQYDKLVTRGDIEYYDHASSLIFRNVKDIGSKDFYKSPEPVEAFYVLKRYKSPDENILLGIMSTYNRDKSYPVSTAVILIEKRYYDSIYGSDSEYAFNIEDMLNKAVFLPRIFYFLYNQSISLESVIDVNSTTAVDKKNPFSSMEDIPFYRSEAKILEILAGTYKGLSIIPHQENYIVILSQLIIDASGIVELNTSDQRDDDKSWQDNKGFVKFVEMNQNLSGRIYINLNYDFEKHYNKINHYLEFRMNDESSSDNFLKGIFAGKSLVTDEPVAATVVFERVGNKGHFKPCKFHINEEENLGRQRLIDLYNEHQSVFRFYYKESDKYTNNKGVSFLRKTLPLYQQQNIKVKEKRYYDIFISIPLGAVNDEDEYTRNCLLARQLKNNLFEEYNIDPANVYCSCFNEDNQYTYKQYIANNKTAIFEDVQEKIELIKTIIFVYPKRSNVHTLPLSSSLIEVGFAMALKKTIIVLCDSSEDGNLPKNLMSLCSDSTFIFITEDIDPFKKLLSTENNYNRISKLLMQ